MAGSHKMSKEQLIKELDKARTRIIELESKPSHNSCSVSLPEKACRINSFKLEETWNTLSQVGVRIDPEGQIISVNDSLLELTGWKREQIINRNWFKLFLPEGLRKKVKNTYLAITSKRHAQSYSYENIILTKTGDILNISWANIPSLDSNGYTQSTTGIGMNMTERLLAEKKIKTNEERLVMALDSVNDAVWDWRADTNEVYYSSSWYTMLGYKPYELPQEFETWRKLVHPDDLSTFEKALKAHLKKGESFLIEFRMQTKDGDYNWIMSRGMTVERSGDGSPTRMIGTHVDITKRKKMEEDLRASEGKFRKLLDDVEMVAVQGYNNDREVIFWNRASENLYGYSRNEAMGCRLEELIIPPPMREKVIQNISDWFEKDIAIPAGELELTHKKGTAVSVYSSHAMQKNADGSKDMYCIDVDLSGIKKAHHQLLKAKEQAESANRAKSEFLANMSHEIRTPLNGILGMLQLLDSNSPDCEQKEYITLAIQASRRLTRLLSDILDISKVEAGKLSLRLESFNLPDLMMQTNELFRPTAMQDGLMLDLQIHPGIPQNVVGDPARLQQILTNILGNAFKFTPSGNITVEAYPLPPVKEGQLRVLFSISDTGNGIPDEKLKDLFAPFTQANGGYRRDHQGAGLGLAICKQLVTLMGGNITIESVIEKGTTLHFCIPFNNETGSIPKTSKKQTNEIGSKNGTKVLLAEDETVSRIAASRQMELAGCIVTAVENGKLALEALLNDKYDLVMMDIQMPVIDGLEATKLIRAGHTGETNKTIPIIAMTAYAMSGDKTKFIKSGMSDYISKPIEKKLLHKILSKYSGK